MTASLATSTEGGRTVLRFSGRLDLASCGALWRTAVSAATAAKKAAVLDVTAVPYCDLAGATLLIAASDAAGGAPVQGAGEEVAALMARVRDARQVKATPRRVEQPDTLRHVSEAFVNGLAFVGEVIVATIRAPARLRMLPSRDLLAFADAAGVQAVPLVLLLGFLMGLILAFQSSVPLHRFGADIYVTDLVTLSLLRELGPLLASIIVSGRTGSAFAAELGTMVVNEEVAAITTMGIDPVTMLVLPRMAAAIMVMPALSLVLDVAGLAGMTLVMGLLGYPPIAVLHRAAYVATPRDLLGGLFKSLVFGAAVAMIGCRSGLGAGLGPRAVGQAATSAVVGGIFCTIVLDGIFTILYYRLGL